MIGAGLGPVKSKRADLGEARQREPGFEAWDEGLSGDSHSVRSYSLQVRIYALAWWHSARRL